jgi:protein-tyrosine phosphatase
MHRFRIFANVATRLVAVVALLAASQAAWSSEGKQKAAGIENFGQVSGMLYRGAQPSAIGFTTLRNMGVSIVVNFRDETGETAGEKREVESLGMKYVGIPWSALGNPTDAEVVQFLDLVRANPQAKIFVHCRRGADRTGTMIAAYRVAIEHEQPDDAVSEMYRYHYAHFLLPHLQRYVDALPRTLQTDAAYSAYAPVPVPVTGPANGAAASAAVIVGLQ